MGAWEYEMAWSGDTGLSGLRAIVRQFGDEGWELTHACTLTGTMVVILRRPVAGANGVERGLDEVIDLSPPPAQTSTTF